MLIKMQGVCKYLSCMAPVDWVKRSGSSKSEAALVDESGANHGDDDDALLRKWLVGSRGKGLLELVEALGGRPANLKVCCYITCHSTGTACMT